MHIFGQGLPLSEMTEKKMSYNIDFYYMYRNATHALAAVSIVKFSIRFV